MYWGEKISNKNKTLLMLILALFIVSIASVSASDVSDINDNQNYLAESDGSVSEDFVWFNKW